MEDPLSDPVIVLVRVEGVSEDVNHCCTADVTSNVIHPDLDRRTDLQR